MQIRQSETLRRHLRAASNEAQRTGIASLTADIVFLSLLKENSSHAGQIMRGLLKAWEIRQVRTKIEQEAAKVLTARGDQPEMNDVLGRIVSGVEALRLDLGGREGGSANSGHFMLWLVGNREFIAARALELYGVTGERVAEYLSQLPDNEDYYADMQALQRLADNRRQLMAASENADEDSDDEGGGVAAPTRVKSRTASKSMIEQFGANLASAAREGAIDPVIGREGEIERLVQILGRRKKNNPILIGEAGVGKSAIVEGLALRIAAGEVPPALRGRQLYSLDVASLVAGTKYRGQFEERIKALIDELTARRDIILFIDEIHTIVGAGSTQGSLDTANILKPALARGELQCIGATTLDEYRENIERDSALERRFQKIVVDPATKGQTLSILDNIKGHYERHHSVRYTDEALAACVELTERYVTDRHFPDKAIDVMDEAGSRAHLDGVHEPAMIGELERSIEEALADRRRAMAEVSYEKAAAARMRAISLREKLVECREQWRKDVEDNPVVIDADHIRAVITSMTGIPVENVSTDERQRLRGMHDHLLGRVVGQDAAVEKVVKSIHRSRAGLKDPDKPVGVFMFVGPTGVGKTHLAKELSHWMMDRPDALVRIDMSEYSEKHNVSRMIGSPPGYVGHNEGGQLTEHVRRHPYSVVLFDEIEKAHPDVFNIMLQIFDEGQLTDGLGRKVDFRNTVIIMTSNVGSRRVAKKGPSVGYVTGTKADIDETNRNADYRAALEDVFAPEFINRIDDIVVFNTLSTEQITRIVELELGGLLARTDKLGYRLVVTSKAKKLLGELGYESRYGVRSLKRTILDRVEEPLANLIVSGAVSPGDTVRVDTRAGEIKLVPARPKKAA